MRFRNLLGLLAIGGAVAYAQKRRGGDLSLAGIKNSLRGVVDNVKGQLSSVMGNQAQQGQQPAVGTSRVGSEGTSTGLGPDDFSTGSSGGYSGTYTGSSNGIDRKF